jgi:hypothetical protein
MGGNNTFQGMTTSSFGGMCVLNTSGMSPYKGQDKNMVPESLIKMPI